MAVITTARASPEKSRPAASRRSRTARDASGAPPSSDAAAAAAASRLWAASNPASYLNLYRLKATPNAYPKRSGWRRIRLHSASPSPWTDGVSVLRYLPRERILDRDGRYVRLTKRLGRALQRAAALQVG